MLRRWLIRSPFLLALTCAIALWIISYFAGIATSIYVSGTNCGAAAVHGLGQFILIPPTPVPFRATPFLYVPGVTQWDWRFTPTTFGFRLGTDREYLGSTQIVFPLWLPTLLLAALNLFIWHKTRTTPPTRAFPVQPPEGQSPASRKQQP